MSLVLEFYVTSDDLNYYNFIAINTLFGYRYANYYYKNTTQYRDLIKAYGILFVVKVTGRGRKFNVVPLLLNIGSGLGLLAMVSGRKGNGLYVET